MGISYNPPTVVNTGLPTIQPTQAGLWLDNGVLTFWDGTTNNKVDFNEGVPQSRFGTPLNGDI